MKKSILFFVSALCLVMLLSACNNNGNIRKGIKDTPVLVGSSTSELRVRGYTYEQLIEEAELIAKVKIVEWLEESNNPEQTLFKAELLDILKGDAKNSEYIKIRQEGNSLVTVKDFPLFKNNDKMILFLKKDGDIYWICGTYTTVLYVNASNNREYAFKMFGNISELSNLEVDKNDDITRREISDIKKELTEAIASHKEFNDQIKESYLQRFDSSQVFEVEKLLLNIKERIKGS